MGWGEPHGKTAEDYRRAAEVVHADFQHVGPLEECTRGACPDLLAKSKLKPGPAPGAFC